MIGLLQRVAEARVEVGGETVGAIGPGLLVLIGVERGDAGLLHGVEHPRVEVGL